MSGNVKIAFSGFILVAVFFLVLSLFDSNAEKLAELPGADGISVVPEVPVVIGTGGVNAIRRLDTAEIAVDDSLTEAETIPKIRTKPLDYNLNPAAIESFSLSLEEGDPRAPTLSDPIERVLPTEAELASPENYELYETRQRDQVLKSFVTESTSKLAQMKELILQGEDGGVSEDQLEEGREKLRLLEEMKERLLAENPELFE